MAQGVRSACNDRDPNGIAKSEAAFARLEALYLEVCAHTEPGDMEPTGEGWGDASSDRAWERAV